MSRKIIVEVDFSEEECSEEEVRRAAIEFAERFSNYYEITFEANEVEPGYSDPDEAYDIIRDRDADRD